ncbi:Oxysterol-binding protein, partial [Toxoplasma gondii FOU]
GRHDTGSKPEEGRLQHCSVPPQRLAGQIDAHDSGDRLLRFRPARVPPLRELVACLVCGGEGSRRLVWRPAVRPAHSDAYYGFGYLTMELNEVTAEYNPEKGAVVAPTDSRFRPDQKLYEEGRVEEAIEEKTRLEEKQRSAARLRPRGEDDYDPLWFAKGEDPITHEPAWIYKGGYWEAKAEGGFPDSPDIF